MTGPHGSATLPPPMPLLLPSWPLAAAVVALAGLIDVVVGEPPDAIHPVVWMGRLIGLLERRRPQGRPSSELLYGALIVVVTTTVSAAAALALTALLARLPWWLAVPIGGAALKTTFSLRGLVRAGRAVEHALETDAEDAARDGLLALVSRSRDLEPPQIASAAVESLAENLTDSVVAPLLYAALFGLPGAFVYRSVNTMDAMIGYRGAYERVGKPAARLDDVLNWLPARLTALLLTLLAWPTGRAREVRACIASRPHAGTGPNKLVTIS
ncbi:MAG TPA: adenosylcobinamide-phosphate synthase CbiB, partial [Thermoleophilia bacterium]|nr:adenosylcobinamide-phosphate synthase CbiB [Thermoleophilia bacterium]